MNKMHVGESPNIKLPQVDKILRCQVLVDLSQVLRRDLLADLVRQELAGLRQTRADNSSVPEAEEIAETVAGKARELANPSIIKVINGTGVVLNTNLGRAPLARRFLADLVETASGYCNLEFDLNAGKRGKRSKRVGTLLSLLTGADAGTCVNNNAAAILLVVNCFARDKDVIVSRGELIEIGGSFRLPEVIESAGGRLVEVGTTNRTRIGDYQRAISANTGLILRCHRSNFAITGFTEQPTLKELSSLSATSGVPLLEDVGSGALVELGEFGLTHEPTVRESIEAGVSLVSFSGDKLLGGPQAGLIVGTSQHIASLASHSMYRALRLDKVALMLLERTLASYMQTNPASELPALAMLAQSVPDLEKRSYAFTEKTAGVLKKLHCQPVPTMATAGGGSLPESDMPSFGIKIDGPIKSVEIARLLRKNVPPIISIIAEDSVFLDFRTIQDADGELVLSALKKIDSDIQ